MDRYTIGGFDLASLGFIAGQADGSNIAISGHLDLPVRTGKTHHIWHENNGIEPYVRPDEIFFAGRDITIEGIIKGETREGLQAIVKSINDAFNTFKGEQILSCKWGEFKVTVKRMDVDRIVKGWAKVSIQLREGKPELQGVYPPTAGGSYGLDSYSWDELGVIKLKTSSELTRENSLEQDKSVYGYEFNRVHYYEAGSIDLDFFVRKPSYEALSTTIKNFAHIVSDAGRRILALEDGTYRECFSKDGFSVSKIRVTSTECYAFISLKLTEIRRFDNYNVMGDDSGMALGDETGEALYFFN